MLKLPHCPLYNTNHLRDNVESLALHHEFYQGNIILVNAELKSPQMLSSSCDRLHFPKLTITVFLVHLLFQNVAPSSSGGRISFACLEIWPDVVMAQTNRTQQNWHCMISKAGSQKVIWFLPELPSCECSPWRPHPTVRNPKLNDVRYFSWEPRLRSQPIGNINCKRSDDSSPRFGATVGDAECSRDKLSLPSLSPTEIYEQINFWGGDLFYSNR